MDSSSSTSPIEEQPERPQGPLVGPESDEWPGHTCTTLPKAKSFLTSKYNVMNAMMTSSNLMWDNGAIIKFCFIKPSGTKLQRDKVLTTIKEWEKYANVQFKLVEKPSAAVIRIAFDPSQTPYSLVARDAENHRKELTVPTLNLGPVVSATVPEIGDEERGTILHEFGHVLGFMHEHQSVRFGEVITLKASAIQNWFKAQKGMTEDQIRRQVLETYNEKDVSNYSSVDLKSIMIYFMPSSMNEQHITVRQNNVLSDKDKAFAFLNYPFMTKLSGDPEWDISKALSVVGAKDEWRTRILEEYKQGDWKGVRAEFTMFCMNERAEAVTAKLEAKENGSDPVRAKL